MFGRTDGSVPVVEEVTHYDHAAKAEKLLAREGLMTRGGVEMRQRDLLAANTHATLALYALLRERES